MQGHLALLPISNAFGIKALLLFLGKSEFPGFYGEHWFQKNLGGRAVGSEESLSKLFFKTPRRSMIS